MKFPAATLAALLMTSPAFAVTLTFDSVPATNTIVADTYSEAGYTLTASPQRLAPHYGDANIDIAGVFDWHSGGANSEPQSWVLTRDDGHLFDFTSFDFHQHSGDLRVLAIEPGKRDIALSGRVELNWTDVAAVWFTFGQEYTRESGGIDNLVVSDIAPVPAPGGLPLLASGAALLGLLLRRRRRAA